MTTTGYINQEVYSVLLSLGIGDAIAEEASKRYGNADRAADWAFSSGDDWLINRDKTSASEPPPYGPIHNNLDLTPSTNPYSSGWGNSAPSHPVSPATSVGSNTAFNGDNVVDSRANVSTGSGALNSVAGRGAWTSGGGNANPSDALSSDATGKSGMGGGASESMLGGHRSQEKGSDSPGSRSGSLSRSQPSPSIGPGSSTGIQIGSNNPFAKSFTEQQPQGQKAVAPFTRVSDGKTDDDGRMGMIVVGGEGGEGEGHTSSELGFTRAREEGPPSPTSQAAHAKRARIDDSTSSLAPSVGPAVSHPSPPHTNLIDQEAADLERAIALSLAESGAPVYDPPPTLPPRKRGVLNSVDTADEERMTEEAVKSLVADEDGDDDSLMDDEDDPESLPPRLNGSPLILYDPVVVDIHAAQVIQVLLAAPQFRAALDQIELGSGYAGKLRQDYKVVSWLKELVREDQCSPYQYKTIATRLARTFEITRRDSPHHTKVTDICTQTMTSWQSVSKAELLRPPRTESGSNDGEEADVTVTQIDDTVSGDMDVDQTVTMESGPKLDASIYLQHPSSLFMSELVFIHDDGPKQHGSWVHLQHDATQQETITHCIADYLWATSGYQAFTSLADVLCIAMTKVDRAYGTGDVKAIKFDEVMYMDRWLAQNAITVAHIRAKEGGLKAEVSSLKTEIGKITGRNGVDTDELFEIALKHFTGDLGNVRSSEAGSVIQRLRMVKSNLDEKVTNLKRKLADAEEQLTALWQGPEITKHKYVLRGVSYFTGWASPSSYVTYVRNDEGQWWKICQQEAQKVEFQDVATDETGLHYDYGPFMFLYTRDAVRTEEDMPFVSYEDSMTPSSRATTPMSVVSEQEPPQMAEDMELAAEKPSEPQTEEAQAEEVQSEEAQPAEAQPAEAQPEEARPEEARPDEALLIDLAGSDEPSPAVKQGGAGQG